jgi:hypothetical protein
MNAKVRYADEPLGNLKIVADFLPGPENLVFRDEGVKVTIALSKRSVEFLGVRRGSTIPSISA